MRANVPMVLAVSLALAACQADEILPPPSASLSAADAQENLLTHVPAPALNNAQRNLVATIRGRSSTADVQLARIAAAPGRLVRQGGAIRIAVAPGVHVVADAQHVEQQAGGVVSWAGPVRGADGWVQMVYGDGGVTATVRTGDAQYSIEPVGGGLHAVSRIDFGGFPPDHPLEHSTGTLVDAFNAAVGGVQADAFQAPAANEVGIMANTVINVMVVYTAAAASASGNIANLIQLAVNETNQSYTNSGITITLNRVHTAQVTYNEANRSFSQHVNALRSTTDGIMDNVHTLRNTYAADVVVLVVNDNEACGVAAAIKATATTAFAVAHYSCMTGYYSFGHEIGHLQGARHDRFVDASTTPYAYGHGFIPSNKAWRTIMAYGNNCNNCTRIQWWSNPQKTYPSTGQVMGTTAYEDNARVLNTTRATVAAFR